MDESWRMRMGMSTLNARRRASEDFTSSTAMDADDFKDVFGGPPRSVVNRKLSCDFTTYDYFYNEIFRRPEDADRRRPTATGRRLPEFTIPVDTHAIQDNPNDYYKGAHHDNINNNDQHKMKKSSSSSKLWRSMSISKWNLKPKSKSKSKSNSEGSSSPIQSRIGEDDVALTSIAAKLRPINVPCRWNSTSATEGDYNNQTCSEMAFQCYPTKEYSEERLMRNSNPSSQQFPSPDTHIIPYWTTTVGIPIDDADELESPSSASNQYKAPFEQVEKDEEDDECMSSYVIEVSSRGREAEAADIDEAIAWAKDKYKGATSSTKQASYQFGG